MRRAPLLLFLAGLPTGAAFAAVRLETSVSPPEATVGDRIALSVSAVLSKGDRLLPLEPPARLGPFEVLSADVGASSCTLTLTAFEAGAATIPALTFRWVSADGKTREVRTPEVPVLIKSVLAPDAKDLKGIKGALRLPADLRGLWAFAALAAAAALFWLLRKKKYRGASPAMTAASAAETALTALDQLALLMDGPSKPYYSRLTDILRAYIEARFGLAALERTTAELVPLLRELPVPAEERLALRETLETADLAKFARFESPAEERRRHGDQVRAFVLSTRPPEAAAQRP